MSISFEKIPASQMIPFSYIEFDSSHAQQGPAVQKYKMLLIGQKLPSGSYTYDPKSSPEALLITSEKAANQTFGEGSILSNMISVALKNNTSTELRAAGFTDPAGSPASWDIEVTFGKDFKDGKLNFSLGGKRVSVPVSASTTPNIIGEALTKAINSKSDLPVSMQVIEASANKLKLSIKARNSGEIGNSIQCEIISTHSEPIPSGVTVEPTVFTPGVGSLSDNDCLSNFFSSMSDAQYHVIACPYSDEASLKVLREELDSRFSPERQIEGMAFCAIAGDFTKVASTLDESIKATRSKHICCMGSGSSLTPSYEWTAALASVVAFHGNLDPARPFTTLPLNGVQPPSAGKLWTIKERNAQLENGISTFRVDSDDIVRIERLVPSDTDYKSINPLLTFSYLRFDFRTYFQTKYPRFKLADDGANFGPGQTVMTPLLGKAEALTLARRWESLGLVENVDHFKASMIVERNAKDRSRLDFYLEPTLVGQFLIMGVKISYLQ